MRSPKQPVTPVVRNRPNIIHHENPSIRGVFAMLKFDSGGVKWLAVFRQAFEEFHPSCLKRVFGTHHQQAALSDQIFQYLRPMS